ncbi:adeno 100K [Polar bear adenovirus 1]|uniref:Shutoff protein n=1 Tax=Polar bear adenovirus 1 TaxID=2250215 RepID=A0A2Z4QJG8_9ADEN|nr:adeno 100K [Polar bear adenovirus 1]
MAEEHIQSCHEMTGEVNLSQSCDNAAATPEERTEFNDDSKNGEHAQIVSEYLTGDVLSKHLLRQSRILVECLAESDYLPKSIEELTCLYERNLFSPRNLPKYEKNGTFPNNAKLNFYPTFIVPETLATYHLFFLNCPIPKSCRANRTHNSTIRAFSQGDLIPEFPEVTGIGKIFEGIGDSEKVAANALEDKNSVLVELEGDAPRLAVLKRNVAITHFAYPAINLPPKIMTILVDTFIQKRNENGEVEDSVSDTELAKYIQCSPQDTERLEKRRKIISSVILVTLQLDCLREFFTDVETLQKLEETLHYTFRHGYIKQACKIGNVELTNLVSYLGVLHENRLGQSILHNTLEGIDRRDYIRDTIFLFLIYTWQTAMGVWQQCLEDDNLKQLGLILKRSRKDILGGFGELSIAKELRRSVFPDHLIGVLKNGLPDFTNQSMLNIFRSFILERSGLLPSMCNALPSDFVPMTFRECPPQLWPYTYLWQLANYIMYHCDLAYDFKQEGILDCHCRCNLCSPLRSLALNNALLLETETIGTFELQCPPDDAGETPPPLKLTAANWVSAYLRKFDPKLYEAHKINFFELRKNPPNVNLTACVISQPNILAQLQSIRKAREEFLLKKGHGTYLDPHTGEELNTPSMFNAHTEINNTQGNGDENRIQRRQRLHGRGQQRQSRNGIANTKHSTKTRAVKGTDGSP